jgi:hypothetical protein
VEQADRDWELIGYTIAPGCPPGVLAECRQILLRNLDPCADRVVMAELTRLRLSTKARTEPDQDTALTLQIYRELLATYPEDAVVEACRWLGENQVFWPALAEIKAQLDERVKKRRLLLAAVDDAHFYAQSRSREYGYAEVHGRDAIYGQYVCGEPTKEFEGHYDGIRAQMGPGDSPSTDCACTSRMADARIANVTLRYIGRAESAS